MSFMQSTSVLHGPRGARPYMVNIENLFGRFRHDPIHTHTHTANVSCGAQTVLAVLETEIYARLFFSVGWWCLLCSGPGAFATHPIMHSFMTHHHPLAPHLSPTKSHRLSP